MVSEVSVFAGPGAGGAEPAVPGGAAETSGGNFASLVAQAWVDMRTSTKAAHPVEGVINRVFVAEWCLAPDLEAGVPADAAEEAATDARAAGELDEDASDVIPAGTLMELVTVPPPAVLLPVETVTAGPPQAEAQGRLATSGPVVPPDANGVRPVSEGPVFVPPERFPTAIEVDAPHSRTNDSTVEPAEALATAPERAFPHRRAAAAPATRESSQSAPEDHRERLVQGHLPSASSAELTIQGAATAEPAVEGFAEAAPRARAAAAQLSKALERAGVHTASQPFAVHVEGSQGEAASGDHASSGSLLEDHAPAPPAAARTHVAAFSSHVVAELQRSTAVSQASHGTPLHGQDAAPDSATTDQIVQAIRMQFRNGIGDAVIRLKPEHLGEVSVSLRLEQQTVSATVHAEVPAVRQWLESQESSLRQSLSEQGLHLDEFAVQEDEPGRRQQREEDDSPQRAPRPHRSNREGDEPRFEVVV